MNKKVISIIGSGIVALGLVAGCSHYSTPSEKMNHVVEEISDDLELQEPQLARLNNIKTHLLNLHKQHKAEKKQTHKELRALLDKPYLDQQAVLSHITAKTSFVNKEAPAVVALLAEFYDSLNDSQREEVREKMDKLQKRHHRWHGDD